MNNQFPYKLQQYEAAPPPGAWSAIEDSLDQQANHLLREKMAGFEAPPPARVWSTIDQQLNPTASNDKGAVPFNKKTWVRLAVAATVLLAVTAGIFAFVNFGTDHQVASQATVGSPASTTTKQPDDHSASKNNERTESEGSLSNTSPSDNGAAGIQKSSGTAIKRYMTMANENGDKVRLSKKVLPVFECADHATASVRKRCKENIQSLQEKMASTLAAPTTDFAGLIDMIKSLEENK